MLTGGDALGLPDGSPEAEPVNVLDVEALVEYSRNLPQPIRPPEGARLIALPR
jgi:hypothetical protein